MPQVVWQWKRFAELTPAELYALLAARAAVFIVEQQCAFQDLDAVDQFAWHLLGLDRHESCTRACRVPAPDRARTQVHRAVDRPRAHDRAVSRQRARARGDARRSRARCLAVPGPRGTHRRAAAARALLFRAGVLHGFRAVRRRRCGSRRDAPARRACRALSCHRGPRGSPRARVSRPSAGCWQLR